MLFGLEVFENIRFYVLVYKVLEYEKIIHTKGQVLFTEYIH